MRWAASILTMTTLIGPRRKSILFGEMIPVDRLRLSWESRFAKTGDQPTQNFQGLEVTSFGAFAFSTSRHLLRWTIPATAH
jgi:hypothetical protein